MSKAYPSNLTQTQYEFVSDMIPEQKPGGRPREVDMWEVLNAIFYIRPLAKVGSRIREKGLSKSKGDL